MISSFIFPSIIIIFLSKYEKKKIFSLPFFFTSLTNVSCKSKFDKTESYILKKEERTKFMIRFINTSLFGLQAVSKFKFFNEKLKNVKILMIDKSNSRLYINSCH